ncbi:MAG: hypothetical protein IPJ98_13430 [Bryobacterales bacterium]|nr:hypothetical protein [Bryobacterales bacterium]
MSLIKSIQIVERVKLQFRAETFNLFNHAIFNGPNTDPVNANFGRITSQSNLPRTTQLALRAGGGPAPTTAGARRALQAHSAHNGRCPANHSRARLCAPSPFRAQRTLPGQPQPGAPVRSEPIPRTKHKGRLPPNREGSRPFDLPVPPLPPRLA